MLSRALTAVRHRSAGSRARFATVDVAPALVVLAMLPIHARTIGAFGLVVGAVMAVTLLWRRRAPVPIFLGILTLAAAQGLTARPAVADAAVLIAFYTVASTARTRVTLIAALGVEVGILLAAAVWAGGTDGFFKTLIGLTGLATAAGVLGINIRNRRHIVEGLRERARRLEYEREQEVALARATERGRIAREMHDVIAHNVSVMVALCDGASYQVREHPDQTEAALAQASQAGRQALAEMRQLLGVLRDGPEQPERAPLPGIRDIGGLIEHVRIAGLPVSYRLSGDPSGASAGIELAVYRIVQEALTNTLKHAGASAHASVAIACEAGRIRVDVRDSGGASGPIDESGAGLRGMRERAAVYGGSFDAGPATGGGWQVTTSLPLGGTGALPATAPVIAAPTAVA